MKGSGEQPGDFPYWIRYYIDTEVTPVRKQSKVTITSEIVEQPRVIMVCVCVVCVHVRACMCVVMHVNVCD